MCRCRSSTASRSASGSGPTPASATSRSFSSPLLRRPRSGNGARRWAPTPTSSRASSTRRRSWRPCGGFFEPPAEAPVSRLRVLVADDSAAARLLIRGILEADPELEVVGQATDGAEAVALADRLAPDVITMDVAMPGVDGLEATRRIMARVPRPIVLVSGVFTPDLDNSFRALEAGAVTLLEKPRGPGSPAFTQGVAELVATVKLMAGVKLVRRSTPRTAPDGPPGARKRW